MLGWALVEMRGLGLGLCKCVVYIMTTSLYVARWMNRREVKHDN